jgi:hypothetical protein
MRTLKEFHHKEFSETKIRTYWIVENSLEVALDIDSMYQNMDQSTVIDSTSEKVLRAANIAQADGFFVAIQNTCHGNKIDQIFWHNSESGLDPSDQTFSQTKDHCIKGQVYSLQSILNLLTFLVQNSYVTLGNPVHHQTNGIPQGGHSSGHLANLTCHHFERKWVEKFPFHRTICNLTLHG